MDAKVVVEGYFKRNKLARFTPALVVWPMWIYTVSANQAWSNVFDFWPIGLAMVLGSFVAGSTPLGGGVVAFPVAVMVLNFSSTQSRDVSVLVQSVGMSAASFLLVATKRHLLDVDLILKSVVFGTLGVIVGLSLDVSQEIINLLYTTLVFEFGIVYWYINNFSTPTFQDCKETKSNHPVPLNVLLTIFSFVGGFFTSNVGSGSDIFFYAFGIFVYNNWASERKEDNSLTASSVVIMATLAVVTSLLRALNGGFDSEVLFAWGMMSFVVVLGAPIGSLVLKPSATPYLRTLFYCLAVIQFLFFGVLKIRDDVIEWIAIAITTVTVVSLLVAHFRLIVSRQRAECRKSVPRIAIINEINENEESNIDLSMQKDTALQQA